MIAWIFATVVLSSVVVATFIGDVRRAVLALWIAGLAIGGLYLTLGAEFLAIIQWIVATLVAICFIFFSAMFGDYGASGTVVPWRARIRGLPAVLLGLAFAGVIWFGAKGLATGEVVPIGPVAGTDLLAVGKDLVGSHLITLEVLALTLLLVVVGGGILARPEGEAGGEARPQLRPPQEMKS